MTPLQFAREQCSNYQHDGSCLGIGIKDDGSLYSFGRKAKCVLGLGTVRCPFFEECVLPMSDDMTTTEGQRAAREHDEAKRLYRLNANVPRLEGRICPQCRERELEPRRRLCYICAAANQKAAQNASRTQQRQNKGLTEGS